MNIAYALYNILTGNTGIADIVDNRISPVRMAQDIGKPFIIYKLITEPKNYTFDGEFNHYEAGFQVDCYASKYVDVVSLGDAVQEALSAYSGTVSGNKIQSISVNNVIDAPAMDELITLYERSIDITIFYSKDS